MGLHAMGTIKQVAARAGVSIATVSHVINETRYVSDDARQRVQQAIQELDYEVDQVARSLRTGRSNTIALIVPDLRNPFFPELAHALQKRAEELGFDVAIYNVDVPGGTAEARAAHYLKELRRTRVDGIILVETIGLRLSDHLARLPFPVVFITGEEPASSDQVSVNDEAAAFDATMYLVGKGHTRIGHIAGPLDQISATRRCAGYLRALQQAGIPAQANYISQGTFLREGGTTAMQQLLNLPERPLAILAANDLTAVGALDVVLDAGLRVPEDIAIMGFDDIALAAEVRPGLTTVYMGQQESGREAASLLIRRITQQAPQEPVHIVVPHRLVQRASA